MVDEETLKRAKIVGLPTVGLVEDRTEFPDTRHGRRGTYFHFLYRFPNNYGASVVRGKTSYGGERGLWELARIQFMGKSNDEFGIGKVEGWLSPENVLVQLKLIRRLKKKEER